MKFRMVHGSMKLSVVPGKRQWIATLRGVFVSLHSTLELDGVLLFPRPTLALYLMSISILKAEPFRAREVLCATLAAPGMLPRSTGICSARSSARTSRDADLVSECCGVLVYVSNPSRYLLGPFFQVWLNREPWALLVFCLERLSPQKRAGSSSELGRALLSSTRSSCTAVAP